MVVERVQLTRQIGQELANVSHVPHDIRCAVERMEERAAEERADQQRQMSELLQLTEAVLAHQPPTADEE